MEKIELATRSGQPSYVRSLLAYGCAIILVEALIVCVIGLNHPTWGDEGHFIGTITSFGSDLSIAQLTNYPEVTTPLPFIVYALWGRAFGFDPFHLRIL